jgi:hypothetical protein
MPGIAEINIAGENRAYLYKERMWLKGKCARTAEQSKEREGPLLRRKP